MGLLSRLGRLTGRSTILVLRQVSAVISFVLAAIAATGAAVGVVLILVSLLIGIAVTVFPPALVALIGLPAAMLSALKLFAPTTLVALPLTALVIPKRSLFRYLVLPAVGAVTAGISLVFHDFHSDAGPLYLIFGALPGVVAGLVFARALMDYDEVWSNPAKPPMDPR